jgi:hypothetical protein
MKSWIECQLYIVNFHSLGKSGNKFQKLINVMYMCIYRIFHNDMYMCMH